jgi:hypothetical protein
MGSKYMIGRKKRKPAQKNYVATGRRWVNKRRKAQSHANHTGRSVRIKVHGETEVIHPKE